MMNAEKHKSQLLELATKKENFAVDKNDKTVVKICLSLKCDDCLFKVSGSTCPIERIKWLLSEYKEPIKLSKLEYDILKYISDNTRHMYIIRNKDGKLFLYDTEPKKIKYNDRWEGRGVHGMVMFNKLFQFVQWEDEEPRAIKDILDNCEVVNDDL